MVNTQAPQTVLKYRLQVEEYLERLVFSRAASTTQLCDAMRYSLLAGGARLRPMIALATADALGRPAASVLPLAAAIEMIHTHALIHADLPAIGDDEVRGAKPTAHVAFGEDVALLAGDALCAEAVALVLREQEGEPARVLAAAADLMRAVGVAGLVGGLYADLASSHELDENGLRQVCELKTGRLLAAAVATVLTVTGESGPAATALRRFGAEVGALSGAVDDIRDATVNENLLGTPRGQAARRGRCTYVRAFGLERARELALDSHTRARAVLAEVPGDSSALQGIADFVLAGQAWPDA